MREACNTLRVLPDDSMRQVDRTQPLANNDAPLDKLRLPDAETEAGHQILIVALPADTESMSPFRPTEPALLTFDHTKMPPLASNDSEGTLIDSSTRTRPDPPLARSSN